MRTLLALVLVCAASVVAHAQYRAHEVGLRDGTGVGISIGSMTALRFEQNVLSYRRCAVRIEGAYGAGVAAWGIAESWSAGLGGLSLITSDSVNDALLWTPGISYIEMKGEPNRRFWIDFSPHETVNAVEAHVGIAWAHEFREWSLETSVRPGVALAFSGRDSGNYPVADDYSFELFIAVMARF